MSRVPKREWYRRVNAEWPAKLPDLTPDEAFRAARRLYRFVTGKTWAGPVKLTNGNRANDIRRGVMFVSVTPRYDRHPWDNLVHEFSHRLAGHAGVDASHGSEHARLERRMVKEVVDRGWLDGALKTEASPKPTREERISDERATRLARIDVRIQGWERRAKRAATALRKLHASRKRAVKALDAPVPPEPGPRAPVLSTKQRAEALAKEHGITAERDLGIESRAIFVSCSALEDDADPFSGDHYVLSWSEALARVEVYVEKLNGGKS